jgi:SAM-dependent methyltransferase
MAENILSSDTPAPKSSPQEQTMPPEPVGQLDVDAESVADDDSALGENDNESSTASLTTTIYRFREENGRTYHAHKDGAYVGPNDNIEQDRLDFQHALCLRTLDNHLFLAPIFREGGISVKRVLDVGTGTGCWAIDFADDHPETVVIGVDLSPIQPSMVPPNVQFQIDDLEDEWTFSKPFDYIYTRFMTVSFANWPRFFDQSFTNLNTGGWIEVLDILPPTSDDGTMSPDTALYRWSTLLLESTQKIGRPFGGTSSLKSQMEAAGFKNVSQRVYKWPQNRWPKDPKYKELGKLCLMTGRGWR